MSRFCQFCGRELFGRPDKKFCNNTCRNSYHNMSKNEYFNIRNKTNNILKKNYKILSGLLENEIKMVDMIELEQLGFRPTYVTNIRTGRHTYKEYACYDIIYCQTSVRIFNIRRCELLGLHLCRRLGNKIL